MMPLITIFTPAYNRASTLHRVFNSLVRQTYTNFEWIVVDDGSVDDTRLVVEGFIQQAPFFQIKYYYQPNGGKHIAINKGVQLAKGEWFYIADSDDEITADALQVFMEEWERIPSEQKNWYCSIVACCVNQFGARISDPVPADPYDGNWRDLFYKHAFRREATNICLTAAMRYFPFPEEVRGTYFPEAIIWRKMSDQFTIRLINRALRVYFIESDSASLMSEKKKPRAKAISACIETADVLNNDLSYFFYYPSYFIKSAIVYYAYRPFLNKTAPSITVLKKNAIIFTSPLFIPGIFIHWILRIKDKSKAGIKKTI